MTLIFYPHSDDAHKGTLPERIEVLMQAAEMYKALVLDHGPKEGIGEGARSVVPREQEHSFNWDDIALVMREIRELPEATKEDKNTKSDLLARLAGVYEVLRGAKMSKLEAVRLALMNESKQLRGEQM